MSLITVFTRNCLSDCSLIGLRFDKPVAVLLGYRPPWQKRLSGFIAVTLSKGRRCLVQCSHVLNRYWVPLYQQSDNKQPTIARTCKKYSKRRSLPNSVTHLVLGGVSPPLKTYNEQQRSSSQQTPRSLHYEPCRHHEHLRYSSSHFVPSNSYQPKSRRSPPPPRKS